MPESVLIIEDERTALHSLSVMLADEGYRVFTAENACTGLQTALSQEPALILLDVRLPDLSGLDVMRRLKDGYSDAAVIVMTADTTSSTAIRATQLGAFDYLTKPIDIDHLLVVVRRALEYRSLDREVRALRAGRNGGTSIPEIIGHTPEMQAVYKLIGRAANSDANVLITGESGTGKELVANALHEHSAKRDGPLLKVNCAAIPETLLEAELFGHEKGAFTNALYTRRGRFEEASGGTLFLDEVGDMPLALQSKLLRAVQDRSFERLGSNKTISVDVRVVSATAQDLAAAVAAGRFREDLYYRLNVIHIHLPPLRDRKQDIPLLLQRFLARSTRPMNIQPEALDRLLAHDWPGNVRELENAISRAIALAPGGIITAEAVDFAARTTARPEHWLAQLPYRNGFKAIIDEIEAYMLKAALAEAHGNKARAAGILGIQRRLLYDKMREHGITSKADD